MPQPIEPKSRTIGRSGIYWLVGLAVLIALWFPLGWFDDATEITPDHGDVIWLGFALGGLAAVVGAVVLWRATTSWPTQNRIGFTLACSFLSFLGLSMAFLPASEIIEGLIDFPVSKTRTYQNTLLAISRAYQTHGKGRSWNIQTMPIWSNMDITEDDYDFMLNHRSPSDHGTDPDEITSRGYFCARVTVQEADDAIRVMHAGRGKLPTGTIIRCPGAVGTHP